MNPAKVVRENVKILTDLPNIGKRMEMDLHLIGIRQPSDLVGKSAYEMHDELCHKTGQRHDPCVIDVFLSVTHFMAGAEPRPWWHYTAERKEYLKRQS